MDREVDKKSPDNAGRGGRGVREEDASRHGIGSPRTTPNQSPYHAGRGDEIMEGGDVCSALSAQQYWFTTPTFTIDITKLLWKVILEGYFPTYIILKFLCVFSVYTGYLKPLSKRKTGYFF